MIICQLKIIIFTDISENKTIELHSPDGVHFCILRTQEASEATCWFNTLHGALNVLSLKALHDANKILTNIMPVLGQLLHIGWLFRVNRNEVSLFYYFDVGIIKY